MIAKRLPYYLFLYFLLITINSNAQINFEISTEKLPDFPNDIDFCIGIFDLNGDALDDVVLLDYDFNVYIYLNNQQGIFTLTVMDTVISEDPWAVCGGDVNNDGVNEVIIGGKDYVHVLNVNNNNSIQKLTTDFNFLSQGIALFDMDQDGWLDLIACNDNGKNQVYGNDQKGQFTQQQNLLPVNNIRGNYAAVWSDIDGDADADLYISKCILGSEFGDPNIINLLYVNENGYFVEAATEAGIADSAQSWASDFADIDNDGDMDLFVLNHERPSNLFLNDGQGQFTNVTEQAGLNIPVSGAYIQVLFRDFNNDGWIDLLIGGGRDFVTNELRTYLYLNNGNLTFSLVTHPLGLDEEFALSSFAMGDLNADGLIDLVGRSRIQGGLGDGVYMNTTATDFNFIQIQLQGVESNRMGVGAILKLYGAWGVQMREVRAGESYGIANSLTKTFGLANFEQVDSLMIYWPSGIRQKATDLSINALNQIVEYEEVTTVATFSPANRRLYPKITTDFVYIESLQQQATPQQFQLLNIEGKLVYQTALNGEAQQTIDVSYLPKGIYLYHITASQLVVESGKLIKMD